MARNAVEIVGCGSTISKDEPVKIVMKHMLVEDDINGDEDETHECSTVDGSTSCSSPVEISSDDGQSSAFGLEQAEHCALHQDAGKAFNGTPLRNVNMDIAAAELQLEVLERKMIACRARAVSERARGKALGQSPKPCSESQLSVDGPPPGIFSHSSFLSFPSAFAGANMSTLTCNVSSWHSSSDWANQHSFVAPARVYEHQQERKLQQPQKAIQRTTIMLRNLPNDYTRDMLVELLEWCGFVSCFDFLYLPCDYKKGAGLGYAFVNFVSNEKARNAIRDLQGFSDWKVQSCKALQVEWSKSLQGLEANIERFRNNAVMHPAMPQQYKPLLLKDGCPVPFPPPIKTLLPPSSS